MHLRHAAQTVGILHPRAPLVRLVDLASLRKPTDVSGRYHLAGMRARLVQPLVESPARAPQGIQREGARHIRGVHENLSEAQGEKSDRKHRLGAVHEREAFLGFQH